ncbi:MAG: hypothetical protein ACKPDI_07580 [Actinomycetota bacterium]
MHAGEKPAVFTNLDQAREWSLEHLTRSLAADMVAAGASEFETRHDWTAQTVPVDGMDLFVEGRLLVVASGRPQYAFLP